MPQPLVSLHTEGLQEILRALNPKQIKRAARNAVNSTATAVKKKAISRAAEIYNLRKGRILKTSRGAELVRVRRAKLGEQQAEVYYGLNVRNDRPGLQNFGPNKKMINRKKSPKVKIKKAGSLKMVDRGFFLIKAGKDKKATGLFQREGKKSWHLGLS